VSLKRTLAMQREKATSMESELVNCKEFSSNIILTNRSQQLQTYGHSITNRIEELTKLVGHATIYESRVKNRQHDCYM